MRKMLLGFFVLAMLAGYQGATSDPVAAQGKKKTAAATGVIEIGEGKDGKFRFFVRDSQGKLLAMSPTGFASPKDTQAVIDTLKEVISTAKVTMLPKKDAKKSTDEK
jgi:hypothetical protein